MTIDPESLELINAEIDGRLAGEARQRLLALLERDMAARVQYEQLKGLRVVLESDRTVDPPRDLHQSIMSEIRASVAAGRRGTARRRLPLSVAVRYAYAFAAGLFIGVAGFSWYLGGIVGSPVDDHEVAGSMSPSPGRPAPTPLDRFDIDAAGVRGTAVLTQTGAGYALVLDLRAGAPVEASLAFDPGQVSLRGYAALDEGPEDLRVDTAGLSFRLEGSLRLTIDLATRVPEPAEIQLGFEGPGGLVQAGRIILPAGNPVRL